MLRAPACRARAVSGLGGGCHLAPLDQSRSPPCAFVAPEDAEGTSREDVEAIHTRYQSGEDVESAQLGATAGETKSAAGRIQAEHLERTGLIGEGVGAGEDDREWAYGKELEGECAGRALEAGLRALLEGPAHRIPRQRDSLPVVPDLLRRLRVPRVRDGRLERRDVRALRRASPEGEPGVPEGASPPRGEEAPPGRRVRAGRGRRREVFRRASRTRREPSIRPKATVAHGPRRVRARRRRCTAAATTASRRTTRRPRSSTGGPSIAGTSSP